MWSLPDIERLNSEAQLNRQRLERAAQAGILDGKQLRCAYGRKCLGQLSHQLWYDIFSDDPKGIITQWEYHRLATDHPCWKGTVSAHLSRYWHPRRLTFQPVLHCISPLDYFPAARL